MPKRIQRKRTRGYRTPENSVYVGRSTKYGNPYNIHTNASRELVIRMYRNLTLGRLRIDPEWLEPLRGKDLACWCPLVDAEGKPVPCHADVLLELLQYTSEEG